MSKSLEYCFVSAFFGSLMDAHEGGFVQLIQRSDNRQPPPINSGIRPNFNRSSGWTSCRSSWLFSHLFLRRLTAKPHPFTSSPLANDVLKPDKRAAADEKDIGRVHLKELLLRVLSATLQGTLAIVPSIIFSSACCTPSPETSPVIDGLSAFREILSISSI